MALRPDSAGSRWRCGFTGNIARSSAFRAIWKASEARRRRSPAGRSGESFFAGNCACFAGVSLYISRRKSQQQREVAPVGVALRQLALQDLESVIGEQLRNLARAYHEAGYAFALHMF
jgi:hypothetical protein